MTDQVTTTVSAPTPQEWDALRVLRQRIFDHYLAVEKAGGSFFIDSVSVEFPCNHAEHDFNNPAVEDTAEYTVILHCDVIDNHGMRAEQSRYTFPTLGRCVAVASQQVEVWIATGEMEEQASK